MAALEISLKSRKNRDCVSVLVRSCRCPDDKFVCPVHRLSDLVRAKRRTRNGKVFSISASGFTRKLREHLCTLNIQDSNTFSSHSFRRGTAQELLASNGRLVDILKAGDWNSSAFLEYQNKEEIDQLALLDIIADSDDESISTLACMSQEPLLSAARVNYH